MQADDGRPTGVIRPLRLTPADLGAAIAASLEGPGVVPLDWCYPLRLSATVDTALGRSFVYAIEITPACALMARAGRASWS